MGKTYKPQQRNPYIKKAFTDEIKASLNTLLKEFKTVLKQNKKA